MSVLRNLETKLADLVEGGFGRLFRAEVRPVEVARRLAKEMDEHRTVSLARIYAPNEYVVHLSPQDRERYAAIEREVAEELSAYLLEHARAERLALVSRPVIEFRTDERLGLGEFGIETHLARIDDAAGPAPEPEPAADGRTMVFSSSQRVQDELAEAKAARPGRAILTAEGKRFVIGPAGAVVGRSRDCDVVLEDSNVSRHHARISFAADGSWAVEDLNSTNGVMVNGMRVKGTATVHSGDRVDLGTVNARFEVE
jgi:hypothetical protein